MAQLTSNKLRRAPVDLTSRTLRPSGVNAIAWRGLALDDLGDALAKLHHEKIIWKKLVECISASMEDQAIVFAQRAPEGWSYLAADGLHDQLLQAMSRHDPRCPFMDRPDENMLNISSSLTAFPDAGGLYEFIEHYWGWRLASEQASPIYLMLFGAEHDAPSELAQNAARLSSYLCWHISSDKRRKQLISDLSAETQGLRISPADVLRRRLDQWMSRNDGAR